MFLNVFVVISIFVAFITGRALVRTKLGTIEGTEIENEDGSPVYRFLGIPYAKPPTGQLRFREPQPRTEHYKGIWHARYTFRCLQYLVALNKKVIGLEDCLYLNLFTTTLNKSANRDVLVFIHGGGFFFGAGHSQTQEYLLNADKELVYVSINYRLGLFGFLSTGDDVVPGNNGLKDQVLALEWIQENIHLFGGNPNKVTIAGMSAGAISVHLHYLSPLTRNRKLFAHGISMSGGALSPLIKTKNVRKEVENLANIMNCPIGNTTVIVDCLRIADGEKMLEKMLSMELPWETFSSYIHFGPVIEKGGSKPYLDEHPYHILRKGKVENVPWLASITTAEGLKPAGYFIENESKMQELDKNWKEIAPHLLLFSELASNDKLPQISQKIKEHYFGNEPIMIENRKKLIKLIGDRLYVSNIESAVRLHAAAIKTPVYFYVFDYRGKYSMSSLFSSTKTDLGISHMDDMIYVLKMHKVEPMEKDADMVNTMVGIWTSFIKKGVPDSNLKIRWPRVPRRIVSRGNLNYIKIFSPTNLRVTESQDLSERQFWDSLPLDEVHVSGDRIIPKFIQAQQHPGWVSSRIGSPMKRITSRFYQLVRSVFSKKS